VHDSRATTLLSTFAFMLGIAEIALGAGRSGDLLELIDTTRLPVLRDDVCLQVSSYDRTGGNDDGFSGRYSFIRQEGDTYVIFEDDGPGCISRIWSSNPGGRRIEFYFDGENEPRLVFDQWIDMFRNRVEPFLSPISTIGLGGCVSYVPIPYKTGLKIIVRERPRFYQINYRRFSSADDVVTFNPVLNDDERAKLGRVQKAWRNSGEHPWPEAIDSWSEFETPIDGNSEVEIAHLNGSGIIHALELDFRNTFPPRLRQLDLQVIADGVVTVDCPLFDLLLYSPGIRNTQSLLAGRRRSGEFYSFWPMPFARDVSVRIAGVNGEMKLRTRIGIGGLSASEAATRGRFHAEYFPRSRPAVGSLYTILDVRGRGHWCGMMLSMRGDIPGPVFLEGDETAAVDGNGSETYHGTGTEDYFNGGWYFGRQQWFPLWGCSRFNPILGACDAYRIHFTDAVPFQTQALVEIEHGPSNEHPVRYSHVVFYYLAGDNEPGESR
jgi:hypothetical protein